MRRMAILVALSLSVSSCGSDGTCTDISCENDASVGYSGMSIQGSYDLIVDIDPDPMKGVFMARCADPGAPEVLENDPELECTASGFTLTGEAAVGHSVFVTLVPVGGDPVVDGAEVLLSVVDEFQPNGEDCEPTCYSRTGTLTL